MGLRKHSGSGEFDLVLLVSQNNFTSQLSHLSVSTRDGFGFTDRET